MGFRYNPPLNKPYRITSRFGYRRADGSTAGLYEVTNEFHWATDYAPLPNHDLLLRYVSSGVVTKEGWHPKSGWFVYYSADFIDDRRYTVFYAHMAHRSPLKAGERFDVGQWAGTIGSTGMATGLHLHASIVDDLGIPRDPEIWLENVRLIAEAKKRGY